MTEDIFRRKREGIWKEVWSILWKNKIQRKTGRDICRPG